MKRLYRSEDDRKIAGVCGGLAEYFDVDPTLVRVGYILVMAITVFVPMAIAYFVLALIMPNKSEVFHGKKK